MFDHYFVTTMTADRETAARLAGSAVQAKLAGTARVHGPVASFWWHLGEHGEGEEWQVTFMTTSERYAELEAHLLAEHTWDNPEIAAVKIEAGSAACLRWLEEATSS
jgi:periplasmic divalent cation tolerance protein